MLRFRLCKIFWSKEKFIFSEHIIDCTIGELDFSYSESYEILVYNNGEITTLSEAFYKNNIV